MAEIHVADILEGIERLNNKYAIAVRELACISDLVSPDKDEPIIDAVRRRIAEADPTPEPLRLDESPYFGSVLDLATMALSKKDDPLRLFVRRTEWWYRAVIRKLAAALIDAEAIIHPVLDPKLKNTFYIEVGIEAEPRVPVFLHRYAVMGFGISEAVESLAKAVAASGAMK